MIPAGLLTPPTSAKIPVLASSSMTASVAALEEVLVEVLEAVSVAATVALIQSPTSSRIPSPMSVATLEEVLEAL